MHQHLYFIEFDKRYFNVDSVFREPIMVYPQYYSMPSSVALATYIGNGRILDARLPDGISTADLRIFAEIDDDACKKCNLGRGRTKNWPREYIEDSVCGLACPKGRELVRQPVPDMDIELSHKLTVKHLVFCKGKIGMGSRPGRRRMRGDS
jgi:hypothetical protein